MLATSFSPSETRKAFPCFDEPQLKATFDITIQHPDRTVAISNADQLVYRAKSFYALFIVLFFLFLKRSTYMNNTFGGAPYYETVFRTTPNMSPNSVGWVIVPQSYTYNQAMTASGKRVSDY